MGEVPLVRARRDGQWPACQNRNTLWIRHVLLGTITAVALTKQGRRFLTGAKNLRPAPACARAFHDRFA